MSEILRLGLVGFGHWARVSYLPILSEMQDVRITCVAARTEKSRMDARGLLGEELKLFADYEELVQSGEADAVLVALGLQQNSEAAGAALAEGLHTFAEPPFPFGDDTQRMLALAESGSAVFHADLEPRYLPAVGLMRGLFGEVGMLGMLQSCHLEHEMLLASNYRSISMVLGLGPWYVDLLDCFTKSPAASVKLTPGKISKDALVASGRAEINYRSGVRGIWDFSFDGPSQLGLKITLYGELGEAEADLTTGLCRWRFTAGRWKEETADCARPEAGFVGMRESLETFIAAVRGLGRTRSGPDVIRRINPILTQLRMQEMLIPPR